MSKPLSVEEWKRDYARLLQIGPADASQHVVRTLISRIERAGGVPPPHEGNYLPTDVDYATRVFEVYLTVRHNFSRRTAMRPDVEGLLRKAKATLEARALLDPPRPNMGSERDWRRRCDEVQAERMKAFGAFMELAKPETIIALCEYIDELEDGPRDAQGRKPIPEADLLLLLEDEDEGSGFTCGQAEELGAHAETHTQARTRRQQWAHDHARIHREHGEALDANCLVHAQAAEARARFADGVSVHVPRDVYEAECKRADDFRKVIEKVTGLSSEAIEIAADERRAAWMKSVSEGVCLLSSSEGHDYTRGFEDGALWVQGHASTRHEK